MNLRRLLSLTRKACDDFDLISHGDKIAVAVSGGKDSLALLYSLYHLKRFYPKKFEIMAITVDVGFEDADFSALEEFYQKIDVPYKIIKTNIKEVVFDIKQEKNPCSLCSKMKKGQMISYAKEQGCNKIAMGHNKNDLNETLLMSLFYEGRLHTFAPKSYLDRMDIYQIRPVLYVDEDSLEQFAMAQNLPVMGSCCPVDGFTKREFVKTLIRDLSKKFDNVEQKIYSAIIDSNIIGFGSEENA